MAELPELESKLGECLGLAQAAQDAAQKVEKLLDDEQLKGKLQQMHAEAAETEERTLEVVESLPCKKTKIQAKPAKPSARRSG